MAFFRNTAVNLLNLHYGIHTVAMSGGAAFFLIYLMQSGVPIPQVFVSVALILFGSAAQGSIAPLRWIALLPFILTISSVLGIQTMIPFGLERQLSRIYVTTGLASILPLLASIHYFGATGGAAAILVIETYIVAAIWTSLKRHGVDVLHGTAAETISEIDWSAGLAHEYLGTVTQNLSLSDRKSPATGSVL